MEALNGVEYVFKIVGKLLLSAALLYAAGRWWIAAPNVGDVVGTRFVLALAVAAGIGGAWLLGWTLFNI